MRRWGSKGRWQEEGEEEQEETRKKEMHPLDDPSPSQQLGCAEKLKAVKALQHKPIGSAIPGRFVTDLGRLKIR